MGSQEIIRQSTRREEACKRCSVERDEMLRGLTLDSVPVHIPTVSPAKNSLVDFISKTYIDHSVLRDDCQEAKRGEAGGHRITRNGEALGVLLLTCATPALSLIALWCLIGATSRGQAWTPAGVLPHGRDGLSARRMAVWWMCREPSLGRHVPHEFMRTAVLDLSLIIPTTACRQRNDVERYRRLPGKYPENTRKIPGKCQERVRCAAPGTRIFHLVTESPRRCAWPHDDGRTSHRTLWGCVPCQPGVWVTRTPRRAPA